MASAVVTPSKSQPTQKPKLTKEQRKALRAKEKASRPPLVNFLTIVPSTSLNAEGRLTVADVASIGYDAEVHDELSRESFANESLWLQFRASRLRARAAEMIAKADQLEQEAKNTAQFGDPAKRAQVKRIQKLAGALAELRATLEKEGIDVSALLA
jgi:hypothetical protein